MTDKYKFSDLNKEDNELELFVETFKTLPWNSDIDYPQKSDYFSIGILIKGQINFKSNLIEQSCKKNSLWISTPESSKQIIKHTHTLELHLVAFTSKFLTQIGLQKYEHDKLNMILEHCTNEIIELKEVDKLSIAKTIKDIKNKQNSIKEHAYGERVLIHTLHVFLYEVAAIAQKYKGLVNNPLSRKQDIAIRFINLLNLHYKTQRKVGYYANRLSITPKYLTEVVNEVTGVSAAEIIMEKIMKEIKLLLNNPSLTISEIADFLNFPNQSFLSKYFKRNAGVIPSEYRKIKLFAI